MIKAQCIGFLNTPPIWQKKQFDIQQFEFPSLAWDSFPPQAIPKNIRLGHQMEQVFQQLIKHSDSYQILLYNLPIRAGERTLGEIDFILRDQVSGRLIHVELTYKFYLLDPEISEPHLQLVGPNKRDLFFTKMEKIKDKQFPLLHSPAGAKALQAQHIDHLKIEHQCCFKAQLFSPFGSSMVDIGVLNKDCLVGHWLRFDDFNKPAFAKAQFYMPTKSEWVIKPKDQVAWKSHAAIKMDIDQGFRQEKAPMIWWRNSKGEIEKIFVVWW